MVNVEACGVMARLPPPPMPIIVLTMSPVTIENMRIRAAKAIFRSFMQTSLLADN